MGKTIAFVHGLDSSSRGTKGTWFRRHVPEMLLADFSGDFPEKMRQLERLLSGRTRIVLVGSSYGGLMASVFACRHPERMDRLILLAPALHLPEFAPCLARRLAIPAVLYHGRQDDVCPPEDVLRLARRAFADLTYHAVNDDHSLHRVFPTLDWSGLLGTAAAEASPP